MLQPAWYVEGRVNATCVRRMKDMKGGWSQPQMCLGQQTTHQALQNRELAGAQTFLVLLRNLHGGRYLSFVFFQAFSVRGALKTHAPLPNERA